jgi:ankyrin repeat protein
LYYTSLRSLLLKAGVDINGQGGKYGNALEAAAYAGHDAVIEQLLKTEADPQFIS